MHGSFQERSIKFVGTLFHDFLSPVDWYDDDDSDLRSHVPRAEQLSAMDFE